MDTDRVQDAMGKGKKVKNDHQKGKGKGSKGKENKGKGDQKGEQGDHKGTGKGKRQKGKGVATCYTRGKPGHLAKDCWRNNIRQVARDQAHSSSGGGSVTTHTVGQQHANVSQQGSPAGTKPVVRRIENSEPIIFELREKDDELEDHGIRASHFYIRDDGNDGEPEFQEVEEIDISDDDRMVRRLGRE